MSSLLLIPSFYALPENIQNKLMKYYESIDKLIHTTTVTENIQETQTNIESHRQKIVELKKEIAQLGDLKEVKTIEDQLIIEENNLIAQYDANLASIDANDTNEDRNGGKRSSKKRGKRRTKRKYTGSSRKKTTRKTRRGKR